MYLPSIAFFVLSSESVSFCQLIKWELRHINLSILNFFFIYVFVSDWFYPTAQHTHEQSRATNLQPSVVTTGLSNAEGGANSSFTALRREYHE